MFYRPGVTEHNLPHDPFKACVVPRPIGWISTKNQHGQANLAPYSQFNNLTFDPPYVMFSANQTVECTRKDTVVNAEQTGRFVWNLATWALREARAAVTKEPATLMDVPMVQESPVKFECEYYSTIRLPGSPPMGTVDIVIGKVVAIHISDEVLTDGLLDIRKTKPIARCGYYQYAVIQDTFDMRIPGMSEDVLYGLEGSMKKNRAANARAAAQHVMKFLSSSWSNESLSNPHQTGQV
ncbi:hypothetical protein N7470_007311 [Penicillium chermesinum]|nr:hypothetical protein N7470_007311 [Penicillium chermesinum]